MNTPDLRNVDFDAYRSEAAELRRQAINALIDRALAALKSLFHRRSSSATAAVGDVRQARCSA
jgi:hypothetical protein